MPHFAKIEPIDTNLGLFIVTNVIVADDEFIKSLAVGDPATWVKTSYNTIGGIHLLGGVPLRKNYAGIGFIYDKNRDAFYKKKPSDNAVLNEETCTWVDLSE